MYDHELLAADDLKWSKKSKREPASKLVFSLAYIGTPGRTILFLLLSILVFREAYDPTARDTSTGFGNALGLIYSLPFSNCNQINCKEMSEGKSC